MSAENIDRERKRSRPVTKPKKMNILKRNKLVVGIVVIIVIISAIAGIYFVFLNKPSRNPIAVIDTSMGTIRVELYKDKMPITVNNFIKLANDKFYDGLIFHRVIDGFMIQGGGFYPDGTPKESPYGTIEFETSQDVTHVDGAISMASTAAGTGGSNQFFICDGAQSSLDGNYAAFGVVIDGMDVVHNISAVQTDTVTIPDGQTMDNWPANNIIINSITIEYV